MNSGKVDICLEQLEAHQDALSNTKTGDALRVSQHDGSVGCSTPDGRLVGLLPSILAPQFRHGSYVGTVRSLKRQDNVVTMLQVRITRGAPLEQPGQWATLLYALASYPHKCQPVPVHCSPCQLRGFQPRITCRGILVAGPYMQTAAEEEEQIARLSQDQLELLGGRSLDTPGMMNSKVKHICCSADRAIDCTFKALPESGATQPPKLTGAKCWQSGVGLTAPHDPSCSTR